MTTTRLHAAVLIASIALGSVPTSAASDERIEFEFNAFGTVGVAHSSEGNADFTRNILVPYGTGASQTWSPKVDSVLAGQVTGHFTHGISAVLQVVSEQRHDDSYQPRIEWANLQYDVTPDLSIAAGRIVSPILMLTDTRRISYSLAWIRPPQEVYELYPVTSNDGVSLHWRSRWGETTHTLELAYGRSTTRYSRDGAEGEAKARNQFLARGTLERGSLSISLGYSPSELTLPAFAPLVDAFRQFGPQGEVIADRYSADQRSARYLGAGATFDPGPWFAMAEVAQVKVNGIVGGHWGAYASAGVRYLQLTPYVTWARTRPSHARSDPGLDVEALPPESRPLAAALNAQLNAALAAVPEQTTLGAGLRWDFAPALCLKLQYDHIDLAAGNSGMLTNFQPGFVAGGKVDLFAVSVSFVL